VLDCQFTFIKVEHQTIGAFLGLHHTLLAAGFIL